MNVLSNAQDIDWPLYALSVRVRRAIELHDRIEGHVWLIADGPKATPEAARALIGCDLASLRRALDAATCGGCGKRLGLYLEEIAA